MKSEKRKAIEAAGWKVGDVADFLEMSPDEEQLLDARVSLALAVKQQRQRCRLTQAQLAKRLKTTQSRVAKIEHAASDVSLDQIVRAFVAAGGELAVKSVQPGRKPASKINVVLQGMSE